MREFSVLPLGPFDKTYSYHFEENLKIGDIVEVPFGKRNVIGVVSDEEAAVDRKLKTISKVFDFSIGEANYAFLKWVSDYNMIPKGNVLKMMLSEKFISGPPPETLPEITHSFLKIALNPNQEMAYRKIIDHGAKPFLLNGVTGSGKTEIYLAVIENILRQKKQSLVLFPEIALTQQIMHRIEKYFGFYPIVWNSHITPKNKRAAWLKAISGEPCIIIGARSALFIPFKNLGVIVVDEEHDSSYKQEDGGFYNARDMAIVRGHIQKIPVILSSATPSLESYVNAEEGKYGYAFVENRFGSSKIPMIDLIDMRQNKFKGFISPVLLKEIKSTLARGEQCLIYLNRRGYSPIILCKSCGEKLACPNCSAWLVYHKNTDNLICHHCDYKMVIPDTCGHCDGKESYVPFGPGVERICEELCEKLPFARIEVASSDTISSDKNMKTLFDKIIDNKVDIIVGTQILAKGHHFPNITLVGIVDGDLGLGGADLRASEKTYQLINQVSGRAGRAEKQGKILIQTFSPEHSLYSTLKSDNSNDFMALEMETR
ncbi:MAG: primosomal protein N', partial [Holosporaceae bacterium]|nr:primosomal protein N' [Holosporaceae bacterium]